MFKIPQNNKFSQTNKGDKSGNIYATKNIDFSSEGYLKLSHPAVALMTKEDDTDFSYADAMMTTDQGLFVNSNHLFSGTSLTYSVLNDLAGGTNVPNPGPEEDCIEFNGYEVVSTGTSIKYQSGSNVWATISPGPYSSGNPTQMCNFDAQAGFLVGNTNFVQLINSSFVEVIKLTLPSQFYVTSLDVNANVAYIGTRHINTGEARLFTWDGNSTSANNGYGCGTFEISSVKKYLNSVACILSNGSLVRFNGGGFDTLAVFPVHGTGIEWADAGNDHSNVSHRGMVVDGDLIYISVDSTTTSPLKRYQSNFQGGVWCYDPSIGLYHKYSPSYTRITATGAIPTANVDIATNIITTTNVPITGTPCVYYSSSTNIAPLKSYSVYYIIKIDSTHCKIATSQTNALAGTSIDLTSTGYDSQYLIYYKTKDYGWSDAGNRGSILKLTAMSFSSYWIDSIIFSAQLYTNTRSATSTTLCAIQPSLMNVGYVLTPKLNSESVKDTFQKLYLKFTPLINDDKIVIKYKTTEKTNYPILTTNGSFNQGTWVDTDTFTTTADLSRVVVGEEIEFIGGVGAGTTAHVASITENAGTYTVNLDEPFIFSVATDVCEFIVDNWTKLKALDASSVDNLDGFAEINLDEKKAKWMQFKIELRGIDVTIEEIQVITDTFKPSK
jgi:hypothetical protein